MAMLKCNLLACVQQQRVRKSSRQTADSEGMTEKEVTAE